MKTGMYILKSLSGGEELKLYHGTSERYLKKILADGIKPRNATGKGNWKHTVQSNPSAVYLTDTYPMFFASHASKGEERWAVLEIDTDLLDQSKLHPDEDVLEQSGRSFDFLPKNWSMNKRTMHYRKRAPYNPNWLPSLQGMGTCAYYGTIPVSAVTRVVLFDPEKYDGLFALGMIDCSISLLNFKFCKERYQSFLQWLLGECNDPAKMIGLGYETVLGNQEAAAFWKSQLENRSGIEILTKENWDGYESLLPTG